MLVTKPYAGIQVRSSKQVSTSYSGTRIVPVVSFVGTSSSGKTTLLEQVVRELKSRRLRVAVVKHAHDGFDIDRPGKDSWRLMQAGSDIVAVASPNGLAIVESSETEPTLDEIRMRFQDRVDIVLAEGFKGSDAPKIIVLADGQYHEPFLTKGAILARVRARLSPSGVPEFDYGDVLDVTNLVEMLAETIYTDSEPSSVSEEVDGSVLGGW